jgi:hypothetical protein
MIEGEDIVSRLQQKNLVSASNPTPGLIVRASVSPAVLLGAILWAAISRGTVL